MGLETKANQSDLDCAAEVWHSHEVYLFSGPVDEKGVSCYRMSKQITVYPVLFCQCPFCGYIFVGQIQDEGKRTWSNHSCCTAECEFARKFDIDAAFMDFDRDNLFTAPTDSPMLELARHAAKIVRFDSSTSLAEVDGIRRSAQLLREKRIF